MGKSLWRSAHTHTERERERATVNNPPHRPSPPLPSLFPKRREGERRGRERWDRHHLLIVPSPELWRKEGRKEGERERMSGELWCGGVGAGYNHTKPPKNSHTHTQKKKKNETWPPARTGPANMLGPRARNAKSDRSEGGLRFHNFSYRFFFFQFCYPVMMNWSLPPLLPLSVPGGPYAARETQGFLPSGVCVRRSVRTPRHDHHQRPRPPPPPFPSTAPHHNKHILSFSSLSLSPDGFFHA